jgi:proton-coupled amino acid transporter
MEEQSSLLGGGEGALVPHTYSAPAEAIDGGGAGDDSAGAAATAGAATAAVASTAGAPKMPALGRLSSRWDRDASASSVRELFDATAVRAFFNVTKGFAGAASFELPWAVGQAGVTAGWLGLIALGFMSRYSLLLLPRCAMLAQNQALAREAAGARRAAGPQHVQGGEGGAEGGEGGGDEDGEEDGASPSPTQCLTLPGIGLAALGRRGKWLVWFGTILVTLGACGSYFVFIGKALATMLRPTYPWLTPTVGTLLTLPVVVRLSWIRDYSLLAPTSVVGLTALLFAVAFTMFDAAQQTPPKAYGEYETFKPDTFPLYMGDAAFLYLLPTAIMPLATMGLARGQPLGPAPVARFRRVFTTSILVVTALNIPFALAAFLAYGDGTKENIIDNLAPGQVTTFVRIFLCVDLLFTGVLFFFPVSQGLEEELFSAEQLASGEVLWRCNAVRALLVTATALVSLAIPYFALITGITGALGNNLLGFILPPLMYYRLREREGHWAPLAALRGGGGRPAEVRDWRLEQHEGEAVPGAQGGAEKKEKGRQADAAAAEPTDGAARRALALERLSELAGLVAMGVFGVAFLVVSTSKFVGEIQDRKVKGQ